MSVGTLICWSGLGPVVERMYHMMRGFVLLLGLLGIESWVAAADVGDSQSY